MKPADAWAASFSRCARMVISPSSGRTRSWKLRPGSPNSFATQDCKHAGLIPIRRRKRVTWCVTSGLSRMPGSPLGFFTTELFTLKAKLAVLHEPFVKPRRDGVEESIAEFVIRRLNQEFLDHAIDALVAGIYAGDPYKLSVPHAFPKLKALEDKYGSMIKGQIFARATARKAARWPRIGRRSFLSTRFAGFAGLVGRPARRRGEAE